MRDRKLRKIVESRVRAALGSVKLEILVDLQGGLCAYDLRPIHMSSANNSSKNRRATIDHVQPRSKGGQEGVRNLVAASHYQNIRKSNTLPEGKWKPKFQHDPKDYRVAKSKIVFMRNKVVLSMMDRLSSGLMPRHLLDNRVTFSRMIEAEYERVKLTVQQRAGQAAPATLSVPKPHVKGAISAKTSESHRLPRRARKSGRYFRQEVEAANDEAEEGAFPQGSPKRDRQRARA